MFPCIYLAAVGFDANQIAESVISLYGCPDDLPMITLCFEAYFGLLESSGGPHTVLTFRPQYDSIDKIGLSSPASLT